MSANSTTTLPQTNGIFGKHHFLMRRLHSLSGIVPVGLFVCMHLFTNAQMIWHSIRGVNPETGSSFFQHEVDFIHAIPALEIIEWTLWLSIAFHAILGFVYIFGAKWNNKNYKHEANTRYTLQRITGMIAIVFIFLHVATLRWRWDIFGWFTPFYANGGVTADGAHIGMGHGKDVPMSLPYTAYALQISWIVVAFYVIGAGSAIFHWANGLWTSAITWGVTITPAAQKRWGGVCWLVGIALTFAMAAAIVGAMTYNFDDMTPDQRQVFERTVPKAQQFFDSKGSNVTYPSTTVPAPTGSEIEVDIEVR
ncbi:hypothetical protein [Poriferisphaera sp. WC338]|uniref:hypothetical protein n=1 Tax=Poriferisphaera sp. WC338 TaxID=3425129 RepID=UPI003D815EE8